VSEGTDEGSHGKPLDNKHKQRSFAMSMEESISLEETNRIRISLGLKPLTDDKAPADDKDKQAEDNYAKVREREAKERESR
jgi:U4/U6.U5 tri-snRNP-associated protein 1